MKFSIFLVISLFLVLFIEFFHPITAITQDLGRHIKTGEIILQAHHVPKVNLFSYTYPNFPFINTHWLSEVIFYLVFRAVGFHGLLTFTTLITISAFAIVFFTSLNALRFTLHAFISLSIISLLYFGILAERTDLRPEIFSFLFTAIFVAILYKYREKFTPLIFLLPIIEFLWVNMHIYFIVGELLIGLFFVDKIVWAILYGRPVNKMEDRAGARPAPTSGNKKKSTLLLFFVFILTVITTFINPNGLSGALYPFNVLHNYGYSIQENQNIFFLLNYGGNKTIPFFLFSVFIFFFCLLITFKKTRLIDWLLAIVFTILACMQIRNFPLFVFATCIPFTNSLTFVMQQFQKKQPRHAEMNSASSYKLDKQGIFHIKLRMTKNTVIIILFLLIFWQGYTFISLRGFGWNVPQGAQPAVDFYVKNNLHGPIFNNFDIGSYLDYTLYPKEKVFVDGRPEAYPASFLQETYIPMQENLQIFLEKDKKYKFASLFFSHTDQTPWASSFIKQIASNADWHIVYLDSEIVILVKDGNKKVIQEFGMDKNHVTISNFKKDDMQQLLQLANFFITTGWIEQETKIDQQIMNLDEKNCIALSRLATIYFQENSDLANVYGSKYRQICQ